MAETSGRFASAIKEALLAGLLAAVLALPIIGLKTVDRGGRLIIDPQWTAVAWCIGIVILGRLLVALWRSRAGADVVKGPGRIALAFQAQGKWLGPLLIGFAAILPFMPFADRQIIDVGIVVLTYVMLAWGLNIVVGLAGLLDLGFVAFYAVGAYTVALFALHLDLGFWVALPLAGVFAALFGVLLGFPVLRLRGDYFAIVTLGFGEIIRIVLINWVEVTGGPQGLGNIPRPTLFGMPFARTAPPGVTPAHEFLGLEFNPVHRVIFFYYIILVLALLTAAIAIRLRRLPIGRAWEALRENDIAAQALGINRTNAKLAAFAIGAAIAGFAGSFFGTRQGFISPESFTFIESAIILAIVVLGGMGSLLGIVIATVLIIGLPELFRDLQEFRMLGFGAAMVLIMIWRPRGILSHREPTVRLGAKP
ncbi:MAG: high-affinity branched-chain amino acid ABC transporter permease LivM [Alphaproteobacteria bacterium]|nr:high-affinity branched-chain amino acid ABC transporter permease LivM [Alphaproteobacteria bacterium]TAD91521.1 MAG: high-affinity branched-chain amino acid ABC transporter permease LivM [Alphaproteobacteria bacterium]